MKFIRIESIHSWGERSELFNVEDLRHFCYDHGPHCISFVFDSSTGRRNVEFDLHAEFKFSCFSFSDFLRSDESKIFTFECDETNKVMELQN